MYKYLFSGSIDRVFYDTATNTYIIQDIKSWAAPKASTDLATPLQFVVYCLAAKKVYNITTEDMKCQYDLPLCNIVQEITSKCFMNRVIKKLEQLFQKIENKEFDPNPSPLCHWCEYCPSNPAASEDGKWLCPYYSLWTETNHTFEVETEWQGLQNHDLVMESYKHKIEQTKKFENLLKIKEN